MREALLERHIVLQLIEDNESTFHMLKTGTNPTMRHLGRTHRVHVLWLHNLSTRKRFGVTYTRAEAKCADVFTKTFGAWINGNWAIEQH